MSKSISLKFLEEEILEHGGWGAGPGETINITYECPCGNGKVYYEKEDTPGFREKSIGTDCNECREKYQFSKGIATEK